MKGKGNSGENVGKGNSTYTMNLSDEDFEDKEKAKVRANRKANDHLEKEDVMGASWSAARLGAEAPPTLPETVQGQVGKVRAKAQWHHPWAQASLPM